MALTVAELKDEISHHIQDPSHFLVNTDQLLEFINSASWDAAAEGAVLPIEDNESLTISTGTFEYNVPATFAYIHEIWQEATATSDIYPAFVPWNRWLLSYNGSNAIIRFSREYYTITNDIDLQVLGHRRPTPEYSEDTENIDAGLESFIRERAIAYAARNLSRTGDTAAQAYAQLYLDAIQSSTTILKEQTEFVRPGIYSRAVPLR